MRVVEMNKWGEGEGCMARLGILLYVGLFGTKLMRMIRWNQSIIRS